MDLLDHDRNLGEPKTKGVKPPGIRSPCVMFYFERYGHKYIAECKDKCDYAATAIQCRKQARLIKDYENEIASLKILLEKKKTERREEDAEVREADEARVATEGTAGERNSIIGPPGKQKTEAIPTYVFENG